MRTRTNISARIQPGDKWPIPSLTQSDLLSLKDPCFRAQMSRNHCFRMPRKSSPMPNHLASASLNYKPLKIKSPKATSLFNSECPKIKATAQTDSWAILVDRRADRPHTCRLTWVRLTLRILSNHNKMQQKHQLILYRSMITFSSWARRLCRPVRSRTNQ